MPVTEELSGFPSYKEKYSSMKIRLKNLLYENELIEDEIRKLKRELLDIYRDKEALLEKVVQYEDIESSSSDSESQTSDKTLPANQLKPQPQHTMITTQCNHTNYTPHQQIPTMVANSISGTLIPCNPDPPPPPPPPPTQKAPTARANKNAASRSYNKTNNDTLANSKPKTPSNRSRNKTTTLRASKSSTGPKIDAVGSSKPAATPRSQKNKQQKPQSQKQQQQQINQLHSKQEPQQTEHKQSIVLQQGQDVATIDPQPMTIVGQVPVTSDQLKIVHHTEQNTSQINNLTNYDIYNTNQGQPPQNDSMVHQQMNLLMNNQIIHSQIQLQVPQISNEHQSTNPLGMNGFHQIQQPQTIITTQSNLPFNQPYTIVTANGPYGVVTTHSDAQVSQVTTVAQQQQPIQHQQDQQGQHYITVHAQQMQPHLHQQSHQIQNQEQQQPQQQQHGEIQQQHEEQLSPEELEQHLESRRMEQAALLMPDWDSGMPNEIFGTDAAIKFMAED